MLFFGTVFKHTWHRWLKASIVRKITYCMLVQLNRKRYIIECFTLNIKSEFTNEVNCICLLPTRPGMMPFLRKFSVKSPLQNTLLVKFRDAFIPITGPLPAPATNSNQPWLTKRRPHIKKPPTMKKRTIIYI